MFIGLLTFSGSLATKGMSLNSEQCKARLALFGLNLVKLRYYLFMISLGKCNGSCNSVDDLFVKICVQNKTKSVNIKVFNMITKVNEVKSLTKHHSCDFKCKFDSRACTR